ncbi:ribonucleoside-diphosphate reductase, adenosylcobalamin-dependent, partial [Tamlana crocina]|nr:ribonucleoside-diphosphate reductase, adenosylcobalamin-dependent [Tamlana crocina]
IASLSNCVVVPPVYDSYGGILHTDQQLVQLFKRRCGVGVDLSGLRPKNAQVSNSAGTTTGAVSFMERFSNTTREVAQNGRRGALMLTIDVSHPDVEDFITIKQDLKKVTGANISLRLTDEFMQAVTDDTDFTLRWPIDSPNPKYTKKVRAK